MFSPGKIKNHQRYNEFFVKTIEKYPCLYNTTLPEYMRRDLTEDAWEIVAREVNDTVQNCKDRWKNLRTVLARHLKSSHNKREYYLRDAMMFVQPFLNKRKFAVPPTMVSILQDDEDEDQQQQEEESDNDSDPLFEQHHILSVNDDQPTTSIKREITTDVPEYPSEDYVEQFKRVKENDSESRPVKFIRPKRKAPVSPTNDANVQFLQCLIPDMEQMTDSQRRRFKRQVLELVENILDEGTTSKCNTTS